MKKMSAKLLLAAVLFILLSLNGANLFAENTRLFLFTSPQRYATANQFWSNADLFLSTRGYSSVGYNKFFSTVSFQSPAFDIQTQMVQIGVAAKFNDLYTALYYGGNTFAEFKRNTYIEDRDGKIIYAGLPAISLSPSPHNEASVLFGIADMGFRLSYVHTYRSVKLENIFEKTASKTYNSYTEEYGSFHPQIAWGMTKNLISDKGLKPHVYLDLDFFKDYKAEDISGLEIARSNNEFTLGLTAVSGYFSLFEQNGFYFGIDLWYILNLKMFNNEYTTGPGTVVTYKAKYINSGDLFSKYYRTAYNAHSLTPFLKTAWTGEKLKLSAELGFRLGLMGEKGSDFDLSSSTPVIDGADFSVLAFTFIPTLDLGLQWAIVPDKFFLNAGSNIKFFTMGLNTTNIEQYSGGTASGNNEKAIVNVFDGASTSLMLGLTFNLTNNFAVQAMSGINTDNTVKFFDTLSGLAVFSNIMVTIKF